VLVALIALLFWTESAWAAFLVFTFLCIAPDLCD
jgi:hypothetical protein